MEHSVEYTLTDGTEYRLAWDTESGEQIHYLLHEDGVLKLECWHHQVPENWAEEDAHSVAVPASLFRCLGKHFQNKTMRGEMLASPDKRIRDLAGLMARPHVSLTETQEEYLETLITRAHDTELLVKILQDLEVEQFSKQLNDQAEVSPGLPGADDKDLALLPAWRRNLPAILWATGVVLVSGLAIFASEIFGK
jgi:hypothetical protein